nr:DUF1294 domain-containing protein [Paenibacillus piri]
MIYLYVIVINAAAFMMMGIDKSRARHKARRIPEKQLFAYAALGGAAGAWLAMYVFRHKTKHISFVAGIPALVLLHAALFYYLELWK